MSRSSSSSTLTFVALQINYQVQRHLYHCLQPFNWHHSQRKFEKAPNLLSLCPFLFINLFLIPYAEVGNGLSVIIGNWLSWNGFSMTVLQLFMVLTYVLFSVPVMTTAWTYWTKADDWVSFLNVIFSGNRNLTFGKEGHRHNNHGIDTIGVLTIAMEIVLTFLSLSVPIVILAMDLDTPNLFFKLVLPPKWIGQSLWRQLSVWAVRIFCFGLTAAEYYNMGRTFILYLFLLLDWYEKRLDALASLKTVTVDAIREYNELRILFEVISEPMSWQVSVWLGACYWGVVLCNTISILGINKIKWQLYLTIPLAGVVIIFNVLIMWDLATLVDESSKWLRMKWKKSLGGGQSRGQSGGRNMNVFERTLRRKYVLALRPISIKYGSLGTMKRGTRTDYLYSLVSDTVSMIITMREDFEKML